MTLQHITSIFRSPSFWDEHPTEPYQKCGGKISSAWRSPGWGPRWMMWCLDHLGISQVIQFEVLPERSILEICVTHMLLIDSFSRKHGIDLCIWEIATDVFGKIIWDHTFCSGDAKDDSSVCLNTMSIILQLQCNSSSGWKSPQPRLICFESQTKSTTNNIFQHMKPNHWFMFDVLNSLYFFFISFSVQSFPILIIVSGVLLPELHGAQTSRSATRSWIQLGCEHFWPLEMASWEWNIVSKLLKFQVLKDGDGCLLSNTFTDIGRNEQAWVRGCWIFCWHDLWQHPFWSTWTKTISIHRPSGCFGSSGAHWIWRCSFSLRPCAPKLGSHQVLLPHPPFFSYICSFLRIIPCGHHISHSNCPCNERKRSRIFRWQVLLVQHLICNLSMDSCVSDW